MRRTRHYTTILKLLREAEGPRSIEEILAEVPDGAIGQATAYRSVRKGVELGEMHEVIFPRGPARYEASGRGHHHHFLCNACDRAYDIHGCGVKPDGMTPSGFKVELHELYLQGTCASCLS